MNFKEYVYMKLQKQAEGMAGEEISPETDTSYPATKSPVVADEIYQNPAKSGWGNTVEPDVRQGFLDFIREKFPALKNVEDKEIERAAYTAGVGSASLPMAILLRSMIKRQPASGALARLLNKKLF